MLVKAAQADQQQFGLAGEGRPWSLEGWSLRVGAGVCPASWWDLVHVEHQGDARMEGRHNSQGFCALLHQPGRPPLRLAGGRSLLSAVCQISAANRTRHVLWRQHANCRAPPAGECCRAETLHRVSPSSRFARSLRPLQLSHLPAVLSQQGAGCWVRAPTAHGF